MNNCKLFETLDKANINLDSEHNPSSYNCSEKCKYYGKCFYDIDCPPENPRLQDIIGGWQKYARFTINDKSCTYCTTKHKVLNILHLINPAKIDDIVIFRIAKKNKENNEYNIRYIVRQSNKEQLCAGLTELNNYIDKKCQYVGRTITKDDFVKGK